MKINKAILLLISVFMLSACVDDIIRSDDNGNGGNDNGNGNGGDNPDHSVVQSFNSYRGTEATLPTGFFVSWDETRIENPFTGVGNFNTTDPEEGYGGFTAFTSDGENYSFGIREREPVDLRDSRLFLAFTNTSDQMITEFEISYDVEAWFIGDRRNRIRLKYDNDLDAPGSFDEDIFSTDNPSEVDIPGVKVNGSLTENRTTVNGVVDVTELNREGSFFPPVAPGQTVYFRWQFSNADGDDGSLRSGLAVNNISIIPLLD